MHAVFRSKGSSAPESLGAGAPVQRKMNGRGSGAESDAYDSPWIHSRKTEQFRLQLQFVQTFVLYCSPSG